MRSRRTPEVRTCNICEADIEVDEPLVVVERDGERETSLADEPDLRGRRDVMLLHAKCMPSSEPAPATTHSEALLDHHVEELLAAFDEHLAGSASARRSSAASDRRSRATPKRLHVK